MDDFDELLAELCIAAGIDDMNSVLDTGLLDIGGMTALLQYAPESDRVLLHIDLGKLPEDEQFALHVLMLESNFSADRDDRPSYSLDPDTGHGVAIAQFDRQGIDDGGQLLEAVLETSQRVKHAWFAHLAVADLVNDEDGEAEVEPLAVGPADDRLSWMGARA